MSYFLPVLYGIVVLIVLWQALRVMGRGFFVQQNDTRYPVTRNHSNEDRTGRLTIHPELLNQEGRITDEELLTVRFSGDIEPPNSAETSAD